MLSIGKFRISPELLGLEDVVLLVTRGDSGVGRGHGLRLAQAGCHVTIAEVNEEVGGRTAHETGGHALFVCSAERQNASRDTGVGNRCETLSLPGGAGGASWARCREASVPRSREAS
jgi:NAD(P)-dependent dehydrogenase (short-subunit alcohol dehydrogenase family)